jgi:hypothetical protein
VEPIKFFIVSTSEFFTMNAAFVIDTSKRNDLSLSMVLLLGDCISKYPPFYKK